MLRQLQMRRSVSCTIERKRCRFCSRRSSRGLPIEWGKTSITERSNILLKIADVIEKNLNVLATAECLDNGKPIRECMARLAIGR